MDNFFKDDYFSDFSFWKVISFSF